MDVQFNYASEGIHSHHGFSHLITREGKRVNTASDLWHLPYSARDSTINFSKIHSESLQTALKLHVKDRLERISCHAGYVAFNDVWREVLRKWNTDSANYSVEDYLIKLFEKAINRARSKHNLWVMYRPIQWYTWSAEFFPELGFSNAYAMELEAMQIPGNPKGEAVRQEDPTSGPLNRTLELPLIISALKEDLSLDFNHLQEKAAISLMIAFGRNPANLTFMRESDLQKLAPISDDPCYQLKIPRIKKRQLDPRDDFIEEYLDPYYGQIIEQLINANQQIELTFDGKIISDAAKRPLFIKKKGNKSAIASNDTLNIHNMTSNDISNLLIRFVARHNIISPLTDDLMRITPRRMRYTLATGLASEGISKRELAKILDHTDTQHVLVYFEMANSIVQHLDKAVAKGFTKYLNFFKGNIINDERDAINGDRDDKHLSYIDEENPTDQSEIGVCGESKVCHLDPPYSCYLCPKFQPYRHADHEHVLDCLLRDREEKLKRYENSRLGIQLDEVISAVAEVAKLCNKEVAND